MTDQEIDTLIAQLLDQMQPEDDHYQVIFDYMKFLANDVRSITAARTRKAERRKQHPRPART